MRGHDHELYVLRLRSSNDLRLRIAFVN